MVFLIFFVAFFIITTLLAKKKIPRHELYAIALFSIVLGFVTDTNLDIKYNLYGYFTPGLDIEGKFALKKKLFSFMLLDIYDFDSPIQLLIINIMNLNGAILFVFIDCSSSKLICYL